MMDFNPNPALSRNFRPSLVPDNEGLPLQQTRSTPRKQKTRSVFQRPTQPGDVRQDYEQEVCEEEEGEDDETSDPFHSQAYGKDSRQLLQAMRMLHCDSSPPERRSAPVAEVCSHDRLPFVDQGAKPKTSRDRNDVGDIWTRQQLRPDEDRSNLYAPYEPAESEVEDQRDRRPHFAGMVNIFKSLPKSLQYDGKTNWLPFKQKFQRYARSCDWTAEQCLESLCWCMTGKAADFQSLLMEREEDITYYQLLRRLENRFGSKEHPETTQVRFQQAIQDPDETLDEWADRVLTLATRAYKELPEYFSHRQAVLRFCQGLLDKETAQHVSVGMPRNMEEALNSVRWFQHVRQAVYGRPRRKRGNRGYLDASVNLVQDHEHLKENRVVEESSANLVQDRSYLRRNRVGEGTSVNLVQDSEHSCGNRVDYDLSVNLVQDSEHSDACSSSQMFSVQTALEKMQRNIDRTDILQISLSKMQADVDRLKKAEKGKTSKSQLYTRRGGKRGVCYWCRKPGHLIRDCPNNHSG